VGPPPAEPPRWPWSKGGIQARLAEARALRESVGEGNRGHST
jgi:hypothetical protein